MNTETVILVDKNYNQSTSGDKTPVDYNINDYVNKNGLKMMQSGKSVSQGSGSTIGDGQQLNMQHKPGLFNMLVNRSNRSLNNHARNSSLQSDKKLTVEQRMQKKMTQNITKKNSESSLLQRVLEDKQKREQ